MFWLPLAMAAGGAILGQKKHQRQQELEGETRGQRAAEQRYSWASGNAPSTQIQRAGSSFGEVAGGALAGLGTGMSMQNSFKSPQPNWSEAQPDSDVLGDASGGSQYEEMLKRQQQQQQGSSFGSPYRTMTS